MIELLSLSVRVLAQKGVRLWNRATGDGDGQFFVRRKILGASATGPSWTGHGRRHIKTAQLWREQVAPLNLACSCGRDERLGGKPFVTMMEASDLWERDDLAGLGWVYRATLRTILVEREVRSRRVVVLKVGRQHVSQVTLIEDDDVIETFAAD